MLDPDELYEVDAEVADRLRATTADGAGPVLVHAMRGFVDAGNAGQLVAEHLLGSMPSERLVTFDHDQLIDYRSRRPVMTFDSDRWADYADPELAIDVVHDGDGVGFLLLHGNEPDIQWERYVAAVTRIVARFGVSMSVGVHGVPMGVPHTRPITSTRHGNRPELLLGATSWFGTVQVPASVGALLELRLGQAGHPAIGFAVHVPHYLAQSRYPQAAMAALHEIEVATGLELRPGQLESAAHDAAEEIERQVGDSEEVSALVRALEEQYDAMGRSIERPTLLTDTALPTADELGAEFERFLADQGGFGEGPTA